MNAISYGPLLVFLVLLLLVLAVRIREGTWYAPYSFFGLLWTFIIGFSIFTAPGYYFSTASLAFIAVNIFVFFAGGYIMERFQPAFTPLQQRDMSEGHTILKIHFYFAVAAGFSALCFLLHDAGIKLSELTDKGQLMDISKVLTDQRYGGERLSPEIMLCLTICYSGCLTAGRFFVFGNRSTKIGSAFILVPLLLFTLIYTARAVFIFAVLLFISSVISSHLLLHKKRSMLFSKTNLVFMGIAFIAVPLIFLFTQATRMGISKISTDSIKIIADHLKVYFSGNLSAFSYWFTEAATGRHLAGGAYTFAGVNEMLGGDARELGIYGKAIDLDGHMNFSNIYTLFRFLMDDFGAAGTILFWFLLGIGCRLVYNKVLSGDFVMAAVLSGVFTWMLFSFVTSVFAYNSVLFAWLFFVLISFVSEKISWPRKGEAGATSKLQREPG